MNTSPPLRRPADAPGLAPALSLREQPWLVKLNLAALTGLTGALIVLLWPHWRENADLSHAFLTPFIFAYLLHEARTGSPRYLPGGAATIAGVAGLLAAGLVVLAASGLYAAALDWSHSLVAFSLTVALTLCWGAGLLGFAGRQTRLVPCNWPAVVAILLWLLSAPLPPGTYSRLTLGLQLVVTENVLRALHLLGIAASRHGNVIELASTSVGVEEACSGVRSLISCVFAGLLFSATLVRAPVARALLIGLAAPLAIAMNFVRSLALTLLANSGVSITGAWHDWTGFAVLGVTAALLAGIAWLLDRFPLRRRTGHGAAAQPAAVELPTPRPWAGSWVLLGGLVTAVAVVGFFVTQTRPSARQDLPVPDLLAVLPDASSGWRVETTPGLYQFSSILHTEHLVQRSYVRATEAGVLQVTIYLAYWRAGQAPASLVASHTPDACWPGSGWTPVASPRLRERLAVGGRQLPEAEARAFTKDSFPQYVWFWHLYDGHPIAYRDPYSARALLRSAWQYGFSHEGDQLFVRVSSNQPWSAFAGEPLLADVFAGLQSLGL